MLMATIKNTMLWLLIVALTLTYSASARFLNEDEPTTPTFTAPGQQVSAQNPGFAQNPSSAAPNNAAVTNLDPHHPLTFFMHDILGGSNPTARAVTGIVTNPSLNGQVPFAKPNSAVIPVSNGVPQNDNNNGIINNNNVPFLTGLSGTANVIQNNGNNNLNNGVQLPPGTTLQNLLFGTLTAFDDEVTEGHEFGSGLIGKAQGFYVGSSEDGTSQTMCFTVMFESGGYADTLSFFGVHRTSVSESHLAIMGGTGKYVNAQGYATVKTFPAVNGQHNTDGLETQLQFTVYLAY